MPKPILIEPAVAECNNWRPMLITSTDLEKAQDLPAAITQDGFIVSRWRFTEEERAAITAGADIYVFQVTGGRPFQPLSLTVPK